ncbi:MAG: septum formation protein Maf [Gemmatimonadetes bacterium]|nr:septum formation protein Maf [Gemmatimonadota bacterium]MYH19780.1 septum formation protein Maf [Gemmatimonadota bacterium]MYK99115.1 septum formation protein Maf [Gemmatimonadota bacterium]
MKQIVLASSSPRRSDLLRQIGIAFEVVPPDVDESQYSFDGDPAGTAERLALAKAKSAAGRVDARGRLVLGADTVVLFEDEVIGKPKDAEDACAMLQRLTGRSHRVLTGFALLDPRTDRAVTAHEWTAVSMRELTDAEIRAYVDTGEPLDKAGSYGAHALGAGLITRVEGCFYNVIGLPLARLLMTLENFDDMAT